MSAVESITTGILWDIERTNILSKEEEKTAATRAPGQMEQERQRDGGIKQRCTSGRN